MATTLERLISRREELEIAARVHGASNLRVFGSVARGEDRPDSDIDMLVTLDGDHGLLDLIALQQTMEEKIGRKVEVVTEEGLYWLIRRRVLNEAVPL